jgi:hypothetical protein
MNEERFPADLLESRASSTKVALGVAGVVIGLGALVCGGVAGYVAITTTPVKVSHPAAPSGEKPPAEDPEKLRQIARSIVAIDIPVGFEPLTSVNGRVKSVIFRRQPEDGALLVLGRIELSTIPARLPPEQIQERLIEMMERQDPRAAAKMNVDRASPPTTREFSIFGRPATFRVVSGTLEENQTPVRRLSGVFRSQDAYLALDYLIPTAEFDEEVFQKMIDSIRPAEEDSAPESDGAVPETEGKLQPPADNSSRSKSADSE